MKKSFSFFKGAAFNKLGFLPFLMTFLFIAGMQVDMKAQSDYVDPAQASQSVKSINIVPSGTFVSPQQAQDILLNALKALKDQLAQMAEGTAPYKAAFLRFTYYNYILTNLEAGKGVADSIQSGINMITADLSIQVTPQEALVEKNAAIALLKP